jgi:threonine/homoserine/homoserine lactone efflux protein
MPDTSTLLMFAAASAVLVAIPGPVVAYILSVSISDGRRAAVVSAVGANFGALGHVVAAVAGLSALIVASSTAYSAVRIAGACYLVYLGLRLLLHRSNAPANARAATSHRRHAGRAAIVALANPKTALFFLAFLPQFVDPSQGSFALQTAVLGLCFVAIALVGDVTWALTSGSIADRLRAPTRERIAKRSAGGLLVALGGITAALNRARV